MTDAFDGAGSAAFKQAMAAAKAVILEPVMAVEVSVPAEYQGSAVAQISQRKGTVNQVESAEYATIQADVPLLKLSEEDVELLESDQLALQGMVASRYVHFKPESIKWQQMLGAISDVTQVLSEIQRTWSYLEPLFVGSDEVKRELPESLRDDDEAKEALTRAKVE